MLQNAGLTSGLFPVLLFCRLTYADPLNETASSIAYAVPAAYACRQLKLTPCAPVAPTGPWGPNAPVAPVAPVGPTGPCESRSFLSGRRAPASRLHLLDRPVPAGRSRLSDQSVPVAPIAPAARPRLQTAGLTSGLFPVLLFCRLTYAEPFNETASSIARTPFRPHTPAAN